MIMSNVNKSIDVVIKSDGKILAGQQGATLSQRSASSDITNRIKLDWTESLPGARSWSVNCGGLYVLDEESLRKLESAFVLGDLVTASLTIDGVNWSGNCIITEFPLMATFNKGLTYSLSLVGTGPLAEVTA